MARRWIVAALGAALAAAAARAELDVVIGDGDVVRGTLLPATQRETFRFACPRGAALTVTLSSARRRSSLALHLYDPSGVEIASAGGRRVTVRQSSLAASGLYRAEVASVDGVTSDDYLFRAVWTTPRKQSRRTAVGASSVGEFRFVADAGAKVALSLSAPRRSGAAPSLVRVEMPDGSSADLTSGAARAFDATQTGEYALTFENRGGAGDVVATANVRAPRAPNGRLAATTREIPPGMTVVGAKVVGPAGGRLAATTTGAYGFPANASVDVPAGAIARPRIVVLAEASADVAAPRFAKSAIATPSLFVGPDGLAFPATKRPTVVVPSSGTNGSSSAAILRAYAARGGGPSVEIPGASYDSASFSVSFSPPQFGRFQAYYVEAPTVASLIKLSSAYEEAVGDVAIGGGFAFVAVPDAKGPGGETAAGYVHVFEHVGSTWVERAPLRAPSPAGDDEFGYALAYRTSPVGPADDSLLVSSPQARSVSSSGVVHEFVRSGGAWTYLRTIESPSPKGATGWNTGYGNFGATLAVDGDLLVGPTRNPADYDHPDGVGIPVMRRGPAGWSLEQTLPFAVSSAAVAVRGRQVAVGIYATATSGPGSGDSVHVFELSGATSTLGARLGRAPDGKYGARFGQRVAMGDGYIAVGLGMPPFAQFNGVATPSLQLFRRFDYGFDGEVAAPDLPQRQTAKSGWLPGGRTALGGLAFVGDTLVAGATRAMYEPIVEGGYVYRRRDGAWETAFVLDVSATTGDDQIARLTASQSDHVAFDGTTAVVPVQIERARVDGIEATQEQFAVYVAFFDVPSE